MLQHITHERTMPHPPGSGAPVLRRGLHDMAPAPIGVRGDGSLVMVPIPYVYTINLQLNETRFV